MSLIDKLLGRYNIAEACDLLVTRIWHSSQLGVRALNEQAGRDGRNITEMQSQLLVDFLALYLHLSCRASLGLADQGDISLDRARVVAIALRSSLVGQLTAKTWPSVTDADQLQQCADQITELFANYDVAFAECKMVRESPTAGMNGTIFWEFCKLVTAHQRQDFGETILTNALIVPCIAGGVKYIDASKTILRIHW